MLHRAPSAKAFGVLGGAGMGHPLASSSVRARAPKAQPAKTLHVPSLAADNSRLSNAEKKNDAVLLILGGTGIVAAPQVLSHSDPSTCFGTSATRASALGASWGTSAKVPSSKDARRVIGPPMPTALGRAH